MSVQLSVTAQALLSETGIRPQIILDIEGVNLIFGAQPVLKVLEWDEDSPLAIWDDELTWDGFIKDARSRDWISLNDTTTTIGQQIAPDKGSTSSISTVNICIIDKNNEVSKELSFDAINDILGRKAVFSIGMAGGAYPEDATAIFRGVIVDFYTESGKVMLSLASPESFKRQLFLEKFQTELVNPISPSDTVLFLDSVAGIYPPSDALKSYIKIDDEIMRIDYISEPQEIGVTRAQLNTVANAHDADASVETFYTLEGKPLELALKIMLSTGSNEFFQSLDTPKEIRTLEELNSTDLALIFDYYDIGEKTGLAPGDFIQLLSPLNFGTYVITEIGRLETGDSYIKVGTSTPLATEFNYTGTFAYRSKYNTLSTGLGMLTSEVDVAQFELIEDQYGDSFVPYLLYVKDSIDNAKDFIDQQIFFPQGLYSIPRKAKSSVKFIAPPFSSDIVPYLDINSITNASRVRQRRSIHKYHYNTFVYRYNVDSLEDKYLTGRVLISSDSLQRIPVGKKQLKIDSDGLRNNPDTTNLIENIGQRLLDRYQFAPTYYDDIEVNFKTGYALEVGDIVPFGGPDLKVTDLQSGNRGSNFALFEVINKSLNIRNGNVKLSLASTAFDINSRYAVVSLASKVGSGSTNQRVRLDWLNITDEFEHESDKWLGYYGQKISIRSEDFSVYEEVVLDQVDPSDSDFILLDSPLSFIPQPGYIVEPADYANESNVNQKFKTEFAHFNARAIISSVISNKELEVNDASKLYAGSSIYVHSDDFSRDSFGQKVFIDSIVGNTITLDKDLLFTPLIGDYVHNSNYADNGFPYVFI